MALNAIDMIEVAEKHSSVSHTSNIDSATEITAASAIVNEELGHGMDRSTKWKMAGGCPEGNTAEVQNTLSVQKYPTVS